MTGRALPCQVAVVTLIVAGSVVAPSAQDTSAAVQSEQPQWTSSVRVRSDVTRDDNVFLMSPGLIARMHRQVEADRISGRFRDMRAASDTIFVPSLAWEAQGSGIGRRRLITHADLEFNLHARNVRRNHLRLDLWAEQRTSRYGRTRLRLEYVPEVFQRNFFADATDRIGSVSAQERIYQPGISLETDLTLRYRHLRLPGNLRRLRATVAGGYLSRRYRSPFGGMSRGSPHAEAEVEFAVARWLQTAVAYEGALVKSPRMAEVMILDEPQFGVDFNGDGDTRDLNRRAVQVVDRSHGSHRWRVSSTADIARGVTLDVSYDRRNRRYSSGEPFDVRYRGRFDQRDTARLQIGYRVVRLLSLNAGFRFQRQSAKRAQVAEGLDEVTGYLRRSATVGVTLNL